jgi:DNA-binding NtrC family response regulator
MLNPRFVNNICNIKCNFYLIGVASFWGANMPNLRVPNTVLIVDDQQSICRTLQTIFANRGYEARVAYSAEQAAEIVAEWQPALAILDAQLPNMNGIDLAIALKASHPACQVLLFSGHTETADLLAAAAIDGHPFDILPKPVHPSILLEKAAKLLSASSDEILRSLPRLPPQMISKDNLP